MTTQTADWVGLTLDGRYAVTAKLGEGGMGFVYRAKDARLSCDVVVKVPRAAMLEDAGFRQRFQDEVGALVRLAHPHVVKVSDFGLHDGVPFAVMQFLPGGSLEDRRPKDAAGHFKAVASRSLNEWLLPVAEALDFIHSQGYVHRDVKPANILFDAYKNAYISDFGVAKAVAGAKAAGPGVTGTGMVLGTPTYMAPELVYGKPVDGKIDQYALAVTAYELLVGRPPFEGETPMAVLIKRTTEDAPTLASVRPGTAAGISAAVAKALSRDPAHRFPSCAAFAKAVLAAVGQKQAEPGAHSRPKETPVAHAPGSPKRETPRGGTKAGTVGDLPVAAIVEDDKLAFPMSPKTLRWHQRPRSHMRLVVGTASGCVMLVSLIGFGLWAGNKTDDPSTAGGRQPAQHTVNKSNAAELDDKNTGVVNQAAVGDPIRGNPAPAKALTLRAKPQHVQLLAGGTWETVSVFVEPSGTWPMTVEMRPPTGVDVKTLAVAVGPNGLAKFELRATASAAPASTARISIRDSTVYSDLSISIKQPTIRATLATAGPVSVGAGQEGVIGINIDRVIGYKGQITITVPTPTALEKAAIVVPANEALARLTVVAKSTATPGDSVTLVRMAATDGSSELELPVTIHIAPVAPVRAFEGHKGKVTCVTLSADSRQALSGGADGTVRLWDVESGRQIWKVDAHSGGVLSVSLSPDGPFAMSGGADQLVRLFDVPIGQSRLCPKVHADPVWQVRFVNGVPTSVSGDKEVPWDLNGQPRMRTESAAKGGARSADTNPGHPLLGRTLVPTDDGRFFLSGVKAQAATLFRAGAPRQRVSNIPARGGTVIRALAVDGEGRRVISVGEDNMIRLWNTTANVATLLPGFPWAPGYSPTCAALDRSGRQALIGGPDGILKLWRMQ